MERPFRFKKLERNKIKFYWFRISDSENILYDSDMGDPLKYGSINTITGFIELNKLKERSKFVLIYFKVNNQFGWKEFPPPMKDEDIDELDGLDKENEISNPKIPQLKKEKHAAKIYYYFKLPSNQYALYNQEMGNPTSYGKKNVVDGSITKLPDSCKIFYYKEDPIRGWKMNVCYTPKKKVVETQDRKNAVERVEEDKKEEKKKV